MAFDKDKFLQAIAAAGSGGGTGSNGVLASSSARAEPRVFMGTRPRSEPEVRGVGPNSNRKPTTKVIGETESTLTESEALAQFYGWVGTPKMQKWADHLVNNGLIDPEDAGDYKTLADSWKAAVGEAINMAAGGKKQVDPWKAVEFIGSMSGGKAARDALRAGSAPKPKFTGAKTQTDKSVDLTDPATAQAMVHDTLTNFLGRRARPEEVSAFTSVLNNAERANPVNTTTTTNYVDDEAVSQSSTSSGGLTAAGGQELLTQQAFQKPEYGAYQASTTYFNAFQQAIQAAAQT